jgi:hypothetical protein
MTRNTLLAVGLGGVVATTIGIATAQPSIADSFVRTINYTTSPAPILVSANTASEIEIDVDKDDGEVEIEVKKPKEHKGFFRSIFGMPMKVIKAPLSFLHRDDVALVPATSTVSFAPSTFTSRTVNSAVVVDDSRVITSPVVVEKAACTHSKVLTTPVVIEKTLESPAVIRSTTGNVFGVEQSRVLRRPVMNRVIGRPALIEVNKVVERPAVIQRVISQPTVIEKFVEKPAIVDCVISQPMVLAHPTVIQKSVTSPVIILDDNDRFLYDFSTHRKLKIDLDD